MYVSEKVLSHLKVRSMKIPHNFSAHCWKYSHFSNRVSTFLSKSSSTFEQGHVFLPSNSRSAAIGTCHEQRDLPVSSYSGYQRSKLVKISLQRGQYCRDVAVVQSTQILWFSGVHNCVCVWPAMVMVDTFLLGRTRRRWTSIQRSEFNAVPFSTKFTGLNTFLIPNANGVLLPWGCHVTPFHRTPLGFSLKWWTQTSSRTSIYDRKPWPPTLHEHKISGCPLIPSSCSSVSIRNPVQAQASTIQHSI